jgi:hypothetical protein
VGSTVSVYVINAITNVNQPRIPFIEIEWRLIHVLKFSYILSCKENVFLLKVGNISEIFWQTNFIGNSLVL